MGLALLLVGLGAPAHAADSAADAALYAQLTRRYKDHPYREVRADLIRRGYRPVRLKPIPIDEDPGCPSQTMRRQYPETLSCSGTGRAIRSLVFTRPHSRKYLSVITYGEDHIRIETFGGLTRYDMPDLRARLVNRARARAGDGSNFDRGDSSSSCTSPACLSQLAIASAPRSAIYCLNDMPATKVFAAKALRGGDLLFALSYWNGGTTLSVRGIARRHGGRWEYESGMSAPGTSDRCWLAIQFLPNGALNVIADPVAKCESWGGQGTELQSVQFPASAFEGPVTDELSDQVDFDTVGRCWKTE